MTDLYNHASAFQHAQAAIKLERDVPDAPRMSFEAVFEDGFDKAGDYYRPIIDKMAGIEEGHMIQLRQVYDQLRAAQIGQDTWAGKELVDAMQTLFDLLGMDGAE